MIVVVIIGLLAAIVIANLGHLAGTGRAETMSGTVKHVREVIGFRAAIAEGPLATSGFHVQVEGNLVVFA